ncbi:MAG: hypothetical protein EAX96_06370 [Candidatus Lokiarchaeota archaeon]|nr:hypothetical protein [Candidatus Lokiarchaeota archaeon]
MSVAVQSKIAVLGNTKAGKTTWVRRNLDRKCKNNYELAADNNATIGENRKQWKFGNLFRVTFMDCGGQESERSKQHSGTTERIIFAKAKNILYFLRTIDLDEKSRSFIHHWNSNFELGHQANQVLKNRILKETFQLINIIGSIKKFEKNAKIHIFLSRFDEVVEFLNGDLKLIEKWLTVFIDFFHGILNATNDLNFLGQIYAVSTKNNFYYYIKNSKLARGSITQLFNTLIPRQEQLNDVIKSNGELIKRQGAKRLFLRMVNEDGFDICEPYESNYIINSNNEHEIEKLLYYTETKLNLSTQEERAFVNEYPFSNLSSDSQFKKRMDSNISVFNIEYPSNNSNKIIKERHYCLWSQISRDIYIILLVQFQGKNDQKPSDLINYAILSRISESINKIINEIEKIYA